MDIEMEISRATSYKSSQTEEERLIEFKDRMNVELSMRLIPGIDSPVKHIPEEVVEYIEDITDYI